MPRDSYLPNPDDFVVLNGPFLGHDPATEAEREATQTRILLGFSDFFLESFKAMNLVAADAEVVPESYVIPPAAEGFAHLFDFAPLLRTLIDDAVRITVVGAAAWKAVTKFQSLRTRKEYESAEILLSESLVIAICEYRTRTVYRIDGNLTVNSIVIQPWSLELGEAGNSSYDKHLVNLVSDQGVTYQYITDCKGDILRHFILGEQGNSIREAVLPSDRIIQSIKKLRSQSIWPYDPELQHNISEAIVIAKELEMLEDLSWLESELSGGPRSTFASRMYQRYEKATMIGMRDVTEYSYRLVVGLSDPEDVVIIDPPIDTSAGHRYLIQFFLGLSIFEIEDLLSTISDQENLDNSILRLRISSPPELPELAGRESIDVSVTGRELQRVQLGFRSAFSDFHERSLQIAISRRAEAVRIQDVSDELAFLPNRLGSAR